MTVLMLLVGVVGVSVIICDCFYVPQPYRVKLYHHESLVIIGENHSEERVVFSLHASNGEDEMKQNGRLQDEGNFNSHTREKRSAVSTENTLYEDEHLYQGALESDEETNKTTSSHGYSYDYETFKNEYYNQDSGSQNMSRNPSFYDEDLEENEVSTEINVNKTDQQKNPNSDVPMDNYCSVLLLFRLRVVECFFYGLTKKNDDITQRSGWVLLFWIILYSMTAGYLWCTKGWCCCCCPCACCHPHDVILEAKQFLSQNPPGVAQLHSRRKVYYDSSTYERDCYKALENEVFNF